MRLEFLFLLVLCTFALDTSSCRKITCGSGTTTGACETVSTSSITFTPCASGLICNSDFSDLQTTAEFTASQCITRPSTMCTETSSSSNLKQGDCCTYYKDCASDWCYNGRCETACFNYTGSSKGPAGSCCSVNSYCASGSCDSDGYCVGIQDGGTCTADEDCFPNYYCDSSSGSCKESKGKEDPCTRSNQCGIGFFCSATDGTGLCYQLYSQDLGHKTQTELICKSGYMSNGICDSIDVYVGTKKLSEPFRCNIGDTCTYKSNQKGTVISTGPCYCDGVGTDQGYCGDMIEYATEVLDTMRKKLRYTSSQCSGANSHTLDWDILSLCESVSTELYTYYLYSLEQAQYWTIYQSGAIDSCLLDLGLFDPGYDEGSYDSAALLAAGFAFLILA
ncbi:unnamed protein product [Blepharisma stoltei]|uniref:Dickkopf N-terminal cysteine-rich domain-containing protein n=1 Tax=Blepharisma stoltei TaxID=1481888 RepID=A0AAU9JGT6_9CILI|nr:unnamed protein product [Blepharisma stoltei]